ncbi:unnamed protein product, partial [Nesidiocoris tenuis]
MYASNFEKRSKNSGRNYFCLITINEEKYVRREFQEKLAWRSIFLLRHHFK